MSKDLTFDQASTIINELNAQATGLKGLAPVDLTQFVSVADSLLKTGYDPVLNAISQTIGKTIFSIRPYYAKFKGIRKNAEQWGNHVRKLTTMDTDFENDDRFSLKNGQAIDMFKVNKPDVVQTNFYGADVYQKSLTYFKDQIDCAFNSPQELVNFSSMITQNATDMIEMTHENTARATVAHMIGSVYESWNKSVSKNMRVIKLVTEYNEETGSNLNTDTVKKPENYSEFIKWAYAKIRSVTALMTERNSAFNVGIIRHTPYERMKLYISAPEMYSVQARVLSSVFNDEYLKLIDYEEVNYWQSLESPDGINVKAQYHQYGETGELEIKEDIVQVSDLFAVAFDEEACGMTTINEWTGATPFNVKGGYTNFYWHFTERYYNDDTENCCIFLLQ